MKLLILGAAGRTGKVLVDQALAAGHTVTGLSRTAHKEDVTPTMKMLIGDARSQLDLQKALTSQDAVISVIGSSKPGDRVIKGATAALIAGAQEAGVKRVIIMSSFLVTKNFQPHPAIKFALKLMRSIVKDIASGEELLRSSDLNYTIVYATRLTDKPLSKNYRIVGKNETVGASDSISRANVADFLLKQLDDTTYERSSVIITDT